MKCTLCRNGKAPYNTSHKTRVTLTTHTYLSILTFQLMYVTKKYCEYIRCVNWVHAYSWAWVDLSSHKLYPSPQTPLPFPLLTLWVFLRSWAPWLAPTPFGPSCPVCEWSPRSHRDAGYSGVAVSSRWQPPPWTEPAPSCCTCSPKNVCVYGGVHITHGRHPGNPQGFLPLTCPPTLTCWWTNRINPLWALLPNTAVLVDIPL